MKTSSLKGKEYLQSQPRRPLSKAIPSDSLGASSADPFIRKTRSRTDCGPTRGHVSVVAAGSCPLALLCGAPQTRAPYRKLFASESVAWIMEKPAPFWCEACLLVPTRSSFVTGTPAPLSDANPEGTAFRGRQGDIPVVGFWSSCLIFWTT